MARNKPRIEVSQEGAVTVVELLDEEILEEFAINEIADSLFSVLMDNAPVRMALSFGRVKHLSSSALGTLIRLNKRVEEGGGQLKLCDIHPSLYEIFVITKLNKLFDICETVEAARLSFEA